ncbi:MAG: hypothetical protein GTO45_14190 [Candidatus Aminicenantes bacterium]|nr:hypothetical protein [Candidatus Aminicenantes bacterium]NIM79916.1 hypothetical protein [Candidatus Aminicenantes bacterium]NIN19255.1 hypothetical protein [Candidatus Aminicenantes bacterium]NIN43158.1 hypothetical protein [Candidatus Aminicenantes bacterium]NIN85897.1 hypothetical protein [Candidatus Aminicenantes bacterium]
MNCPHCKAELSEGASFCYSCGFDLKKEKPAEMQRQKVDSKVEYGGYLAVGGWLTIIAGVIITIIICSQANTGFRGFDSRIFLTGVGVFISMIIYAWLYFGLHKAILKISRIEQALGIDK